MSEEIEKVDKVVTTAEDMTAEGRGVWITTIDNPYDPFRQWEHWYNFDMAMGYDTCGNIARLAMYTENLTPAEELERQMFAINQLLETKFVTGIGDCLSQYVIAIEGQCQVW